MKMLQMKKTSGSANFEISKTLWFLMTESAKNCEFLSVGGSFFSEW